MPTLHPKSRSWNRWLQFRVRSLFVLMVVIAVPLGWKVNKIRIQRTLVAEIQQRGGSIAYDFQTYVVREGGCQIRESRPIGPSWMRALIGDDFWAEIAFVGVFDDSCDDARLARWSTLHGFRELAIPRSGVTDRGLAHVARMNKLTRLNLAGTHVTNAGLIHLTKLACLNSLRLDDTAVTSTEIAALPLCQLRHLSLSRTLIGDYGLEHLHGMNNLKSLELSGTQITDAGLMRLLESGVTNLAFLDVSHCAISDTSVLALRTIPALRVVCLNDTYVSVAACQQLEAARPDIGVRR